MSTSFEMFSEGLSYNLAEKDSGKEAKIIKSLSMICNCFGNREKEITEVVLQNETTRRNFVMVAAGCMVAMGYAGKCEDHAGRGHWDMRNQVSTQYCKEHFDQFMEMFTETAGFSLMFRENPDYQYFDLDCTIGRSQTRGMLIAEEIKNFERDHPTLQQAMIGVFLRIIGNNNLYAGVEVTGFPFIQNKGENYEEDYQPVRL